MKAERRHQLQDNTLAKHLETLPEWAMRNASRMMLIVTAILLGWFIVRYRVNSVQQKHIVLSDALRSMHEGINGLSALDTRSLSFENIARGRAQATSQVNTAIETVLREADASEDAVYRAQALLARGDLNWTLANAMPLPGAATQPVLQLPRGNDEYLKQADDAYHDVVSAYSPQTTSWIGAEMGIAAVAENRHDWDAARQAYVAVMARDDVPDVFKHVAQNHLADLPQLKSPALLGSYPPAPQEAPAPTNIPMAPMFSQPSAPSNAPPSSQPAEPSTPPSTLPSMTAPEK